MTKIQMAKALVDSTYDLSNIYVRGTDGDRDAAAVAWTEVVHGCTMVCCGRHLRDGDVRYDQPGSMAPGQKSDIIFAPAGLSKETKLYLRRRTAKLYIVSVDDHPDTRKRKEEAAKPVQYYHQCDHGHKWSGEVLANECPQCGEPSV